MSISQSNAKVTVCKRIGDNYALLVITHPGIAKCARPGQFVMVKACEGVQPLLRRPLGIHRVAGNSISLFFEVRGPGTRILAQRKAGEYLDVIGPLGNGFEYPASLKPDASCLLVAGGMGVAPLVFLAQKMSKVAARTAKGAITVLIGAKSKSHVHCEKEFKALGCRVKIATDDGSRGYKGYVSELLLQVLRSAHNAPEASIYACGPHPMLQEVSRIAMALNVPAQVSLEEHMACGIGACLGCVVNTRQGNKRVCKDGPMFGAQEVVW